MVEEKDEEDTTIPKDAHISSFERPTVKKDTTSVCQDVDSNRSNGSLNDAASNYFELEGHQHKKMVVYLLEAVDLHPVQFQGQVGGTFTAFASRRSIKRHITDESKKEKT